MLSYTCKGNGVLRGRCNLGENLLSDQQVRFLIAALESKYQHNRNQAARKLAESQDPRAIPALIACLIDPDRLPDFPADGDHGAISTAIPQAVASFGREASRQLAQHIKEPRVIYTLGLAGDDIAIKILMESYKSVGYGDRYAIVYALSLNWSNVVEDFLRTRLRIERFRDPFVADCIKSVLKENRAETMKVSILTVIANYLNRVLQRIRPNGN